MLAIPAYQVVAARFFPELLWQGVFYMNEKIIKTLRGNTAQVRFGLQHEKPGRGANARLANDNASSTVLVSRAIC